MKNILLSLLFLINFVFANHIDLTNEEHNYLQNHPIIIVGHANDLKPYSFINDRGMPVGFYYNVYQLLEIELNLKFQYKIDSWEETIKNLKNGKIDIIPSIDYELAQKYGFITTDTIINNKVTALRSEQKILQSIMKKAINSITQGQKELLLKKWDPIDNKDRKLTISKEEKEYFQNKKFNIYLNNWEPFAIINTNKPYPFNIQGLAIDTWEELAKEFNIQYQFIPVNKFTDILAKLEEDENAVTLSTNLTKKREKYAIATKPYNSFSIAFATKNNENFKVSANDFKGKTVAVGKNFTSHKLLEKYYPSIKLKLVNNTLEALDLVSKDLVDAAADIIPVLKYNMEKYHYNNLKISGLTKENYDIQILTNKKNIQLIDSLNKIIYKKNIKETQDKWFFGFNSQKEKLNLSQDELEYLKTNTFNLYLNDWKPFRIYNKKTKKYSGMAIDYFEELAKLLDLNYEIKHFDSFVERMEAERNDSTALSIFTAKLDDRKDFVSFSLPYASYPIGLVTNLKEDFVSNFDNLKGKKIAVGENYSAYRFLKEFYPDIEYVFVKNTLEALNKTAKGEVYGAIDLVPNLYYNLKISGIQNLKIAGESEQQLDIAISINNEHQKLINILNKAIKYFSEDLKNKIEAKHLFGELSFYKNIFKLNENEKQFLQNKNKFVVCSRKNHYPASGVKDNKLIGAIGDVYNEIAQILNIEFKAIGFKSNKEMMNAISENRCDFLSIVKNDFDGFKNIKTTKTIFKTKFAIMGNTESFVFDNDESLNGHKVYVKDEIQKKVLEDNYPNINIKLETNLNTIMEKIAEDNYSHYVDNFINIDYLIQKYGVENYKFNGLLQKIDAEGSIGVNIEKNPILVDIINKTLIQIGQKKIDEILNQYRLKEYIIKKDFNIYLIYIIIISSLLLVFLIYRQNSLKRQNILIENEKNKFMQIIDNSADNIHILNKEGKLIYASNAFAKFLGFKKAHIIGKYVSFWDKEVSNEKDIISKLMENPKTFITKHEKSDGSLITVKVNTSLLMIDGEKYLYASSLDISDSIELKQLKELKQIFEQTQSTAKIASWKHFIKSDYYWCSKEYLKIFEVDDITKDKFKLNDLLPFIHEEDLKAFKETLKRSHTKNDINNFEFRIKTKKGNIKYLEMNWENISNKKGEVKHSIGTIQDITEKYLINIDKEQKKAILIHQNRLAQLGEMISMIAHQWRQPLAALSVWKTNLLISIKNNDKDLDTIDMIDTKMSNIITHLTSTIDDFRNYYKPSKEKEKFEIIELINETLDILDYSLNNKNITLEKNLSSNLYLYNYKSELKQVLLAIINNASEALININEKRIIKINAKALGESQVVIEVLDNANGIEDEYIDKIFEPYFSTKTEMNGTGIGLYMSKMLINHLKGHIEVETSKQGSLFRLIFSKEE